MGKTVLPLFLSCSWSDPFHTCREQVHESLDEFEIWPDLTAGSETLAACDLKVGRCRQLIEIMKVCEY